MNTLSQAGLVGMLVVYSPQYEARALALFMTLLRRVDPRCLFIVINNNAQRVPEVPEGVVLLQGSNEMHEFGAWQQGVDHLRAQPIGETVRCVVFANDTFCFHRRFEWIERYSFVRATAATASATRPAASGELATFRPEARLQEVSVGDFLITNFFAVNRGALDRLGWRLHGPLAEIERLVPGGLDERSFYSSELDASAALRYSRWLFGRPGHLRWAKGGPLTAANSSMYRMKSFMLLCEALLTARLLKSGVEISSVFASPVIRLLRWFPLKARKLRHRVSARWHRMTQTA